MKAHEHLDKLKQILESRGVTHGDKIQNHENIARLWSAYLANRFVGGKFPACTDLSATDAALMLVLFKVARTQAGAFNEDDFDDLIGYAAIAAECATRRNANQARVEPQGPGPGSGHGGAERVGLGR